MWFKTHRLWWKVVLLLALLSAAGVGQNCVQTSTCSCRYGDGTELTLIFDVSSLGNGPIFDDEFKTIWSWDSYGYSYRPCLPWSESNCTNAAVCRLDKGSIPLLEDISIGDYNLTSFVYNATTDDFTIVYKTQRDSSVSSYVKFICDPKAKEVQYKMFAKSRQSETYYFEITSDKACPTKVYHTTTAIPRAIIEGRIDRKLTELNLSISSLKTTGLFTAVLLTAFCLVAMTSLICYVKGKCRQYTKLGV